jgi:molybdopterin-binding protein
MPQIRISDAASLLGVSDDTVRRWVDSGRLTAGADESGRKTVDSAEVAAVLSEASIEPERPVPTSARNRFPGIVTRVERDGVMALVEVQSGPHRIVSLISREGADELGLEPGVIVAASVKSTNVVIERETL